MLTATVEPAPTLQLFLSFRSGSFPVSSAFSFFSKSDFSRLLTQRRQPSTCCASIGDRLNPGLVALGQCETKSSVWLEFRRLKIANNAARHPSRGVKVMTLSSTGTADLESDCCSIGNELPLVSSNDPSSNKT